ncbi:hypothetical protein [Tengunoibacter tsumagoiensis]|uniref:Uncharacterized protein n=1 Tax=Tengunoibacter tsumagoiensis TaxID=2014871 RepID=A0A402A7F3_9CHLR|nr:hypothetical protein [Tengunoibacter tsumagoiensis]GCE15087.1 hypothetical protein KTT_49460 [Tengunoibacter tsumagoiensis]
MDNYKDFNKIFAKRLEEGFDDEVSEKDVPHYRTVHPKLMHSTHHVGALDGSDQQLFALEGNPDAGLAIWATLYIEYALSHPHEELYREGPGSEPWAAHDVHYYQLAVKYGKYQDDKNRGLRNDYYAIRQILSSARATEPPLYEIEKNPRNFTVREEAALARANEEWRALRRSYTYQLAPHDLLLRDGRFNCQLEQAASSVDQSGREASIAQVRAIAVVKSGDMYGYLYPCIQYISRKTTSAFYFRIPKHMIEQCYQNEVYKRRKTLMLGGRDHTDLAGIGAAWVAFCPDPYKPETFVILEFNLYDLFYYKKLAKQAIILHDWQQNYLTGPTHHGDVYVTDILIHEEYDVENLIEPAVQEILWLCDQEVGRFNYPNLLGTAHHDVVLTQKKAKFLRPHYYEEIMNDSNILLERLISFNFVEDPHKIHNIY